MKLKMREFFQGRDVWALLLPRHVQVTVLEPDSEYEVDETLGEYLLKARKAEKVPERIARHLDVEPQFEQAEEPPRPLPVPRKRGKRS